MFHKSWVVFLEEIKAAKKDLEFKDYEEVFFRGHIQVTYKLLPGIFRKLSDKLSEEKLWEIESDMFYEFRARAKEVHSGNLSDWDILFYMQHHGVFTRLLDWTESFGVALYFAMLDYEKGISKPCIWMLNPYKLNEVYHCSRDMYAPEKLDGFDQVKGKSLSYADFLLHGTPGDLIWWKQPLALYPIRRVDRLTTQGGYFTIQGTDVRPIEDIIDPSENIWRKIPLPDDAYESALLFLDQAGINHYTMFPDLDGLSIFLNKKYFELKIV
ncbi:MAG: FRG domain-containing protein [Chitinophagaceae bacterium]|nr:FRG domain-containing protein [Chitinophagaceae bacterium]